MNKFTLCFVLVLSSVWFGCSRGDKHASNATGNGSISQTLHGYEVVTNAINTRNWDTLRGLTRKEMRANDYIQAWEKNPVRVGKLISVDKDSYYLDGKPCVTYSFAWEPQDGTSSVHQFQILIREENGKSTILDFWNFGW